MAGSPLTASPPPTNGGTPYGKPAGNRRRNTTLALIVAAAVIAVAGVVVGLSFRPGASEAQIQPPRGGGDAPVLGAGPGDDGSGQGSGRQLQPGAPVPSRGDGASRTRTKAPTTPSAGAPTAEPSQTASAPTGGTAANPYTPKQVCGLGFVVIDQAALKDSGGAVQGRVYLLYNAVTGKNCTATIKTTQVGTASAASAYLEVQGAARTIDSGSFEYYAGPVRAKAAAVCVKWGGSVGGASYDSPFEHCS